MARPVPPIDEAARAAKQALRAQKRDSKIGAADTAGQSKGGDSTVKFSRFPPLIGTQAHNLFADLSSKSDREAALVVHAMVDHLMEMALRSYFPLDVDTRVFDPTQSVLSSFFSKMMVGQALGILNTILINEPRVLSFIRNTFAHSASEITFNTQGFGAGKSPAEKCAQLSLPECYIDVYKTLPVARNIRQTDDDLEGIVLTDELGSISVDCRFKKEDVITPKGRYIVTANLVRTMMTSVAENKRPTK